MSGGLPPKCEGDADDGAQGYEAAASPDVRVVRLPRHGASCPVGIGVSCSADRQAKAKITAGAWGPLEAVCFLRYFFLVSLYYKERWATAWSP
jgi:hypothetical protein